MSATTLSNVFFDSQLFSDTLAMTFTDKLELFRSGVLAGAPDAMISPVSAGYTVAIPKWDALTGDSDQITEGGSTTINMITDADDVGVWVEREKAWGANQFLKFIAGADATQGVASGLANYWAKEVHKSAVKVLSGAMATALSSTHSTGASYSAATIETTGGTAAKLLLGDNSEMLTSVLMNSKVHTDAVRDRLVVETPGGDRAYASGSVQSFLGSRVYVTDQLAASSSVYPTYFAAPGSMIYKFRNRTLNNITDAQIFEINTDVIRLQVELNRQPLTSGGQDEIITRCSYLVHIPGVAWAGSSNPTNTALGTGSNWSKVYSDNKLIRIAELKTL